MLRKAFTLIELLVVIAIIAILAAILFPVFAQAKESAKITVVLSQAKQLGTAMVMYGSDNDDNFPLAMAKRPNGGAWGAGLLHPYPADQLVADATWGLPERIAMAGQMWANSTQPYVKSLEMNEVKGLPDYLVTTDVYKYPNAKTCLTMNGLLHGLSQTSINSPSVVPMLWPGEGAVNVKGRATMNPALNCGTADDCRFNPGGPPSSVLGTSTANGNDSMYITNTTTTSVWTFSRRRAPFVRTDSSAKALVTGTVIKPNVIAFGNGVLTDPYAAVAANGTAPSFWQCAFDGSGNVISGATNNNYTCYFRPDRTQ